MKVVNSDAGRPAPFPRLQPAGNNPTWLDGWQRFAQESHGSNVELLFLAPEPSSVLLPIWVILFSIPSTARTVLLMENEGFGDCIVHLFLPSPLQKYHALQTTMSPKEYLQKTSEWSYEWKNFTPENKSSFVNRRCHHNSQFETVVFSEMHASHRGRISRAGAASWWKLQVRNSKRHHITCRNVTWST